jgi:hypothetical protein
MTRNRARKREREEEQIEETKDEQESLIIIKFAENDPTTPLVHPQRVTPSQMHAAAAMMQLIADQGFLGRWQQAAMEQARKNAEKGRLVKAVSTDILQAQ